MSRLQLTKIKQIFSERTPGTVGVHKYYSILVPLIEKDGELHVLYEVRAAHMKRQPGEVCFPGGQLEENETIEQCAVRETAEELGLEPEAITVLAQMDTVYTYSNFTMYSFLGTIEYKELLNAVWNSDEVQDTFLVPIEEVVQKEPLVYRLDVKPIVGDDFPYNKIGMGKTYQWRTGVSEVPIYQFGNRIVWGLTGRITKKFAEVLRGGIE